MDDTVTIDRIARYLGWSYSGMDASIPGNGGPDCANFLSMKWRLLESTFACLVGLSYFLWGYSRISYPTTCPFIRSDRGGKRILLVLVSLTFGVEIGFKLATRQLIYLLNPCHITVMIQIYLLAAPPSKHVTAVFRIQMNYLAGAILAILFPVTNARLLPFENEIYWIEHVMMLVTPYYLLRLGGVYHVEKLTDLSWTAMATGLLFVYHFLPLQYIGLLTEVNLNNMLCPAISDPFYGPYYRLMALCHQTLFIPLVSKLYCLLAGFFITKFVPTKIKDQLETDVTLFGRDDSNRVNDTLSTNNNELSTVRRHLRSTTEENTGTSEQ